MLSVTEEESTRGRGEGGYISHGAAIASDVIAAEACCQAALSNEEDGRDEVEDLTWMPEIVEEESDGEAE